MNLEPSSAPQSDPGGRSKESKPPHFTPTDDVPKASVTTQVLDKLNIPYTYEEFADEVHSMNVWRPSVNNFIAKLFPVTGLGFPTR
ncbi:MAG: hypothetical protein JOZ08_25250 [Verrucomicrobia bacterium]|nr:hypothetical protein [Verrucomicrobiota bacterium]